MQGGSGVCCQLSFHLSTGMRLITSAARDALQHRTTRGCKNLRCIKYTYTQRSHTYKHSIPLPWHMRAHRHTSSYMESQWWEHYGIQYT